MALPGAVAQTLTPPAPCGTDLAQRRLLGPAYEARRQQYRARIAAARAATGNAPRSASGPRLIIPMVIHIIHDGGASALDDAQIFDAVRILNEDFQKQNADTALVVPPFQQRVGDVNVEFRLAKLDPQGNCTNGITRTFSPLANSADDNVKDLISWDGTRYLNIWVVKNISFGAAGYAYLPCWVGPDIDGIVILNGYIGSIGIGNVRNSRALTHEVGHYLGLNHTWGGTNDPGVPANCSDDDDVLDTPNTVGSSPGNCNLQQAACPGAIDPISNVQNYMDYSYCSVMFTQGQADLMYDGLALSTFGSCHATLTTAANLQVTGVADGLNLGPCAPVVAITPALGATDIRSARGCAGDSVRFEGAAYNLPVGAAVSWQWSFPGGQPATSTRRTPAVVYAAPGTYPVTLTATVPGAPVGTLTETNFARIASRTAGLTAPDIELFEAPQFPLNPTNAAATWEIESTAPTPAAPTWAYTSAAAQQGTGAARVALRATAANPTGTRHVLTSPTIVLGAAITRPFISYRHAYAQSTPLSADRLDVALSFDCGRTWTTRQRRAGTGLARGNAPVSRNTAFVPTAAQWHEERITLGQTLPAGSSFRIRFMAIADDGNALFLDNIHVETSPVLGTGDETDALPSLTAATLTLVPNPSAGADATVRLTLPTAAAATLRLTDATGRRLGVSQTVRGAGPHEIGLRTLAGPLAAGLYFVEMTTTDGDRLVARTLVY